MPFNNRATEQLVALGPRAILFAFTSSSYALGAAADNLVRTRLEKRAQGIPVMLTCQAATAALRLLQIQRLSIIHPPWFSDDSNDQGMAYFRAQGFDIVQCTRMTPARSFTEVTPAEVFTSVCAKTPATAEAVFIGGNGLRVVGAIRALEARLGKLVEYRPDSEPEVAEDNINKRTDRISIELAIGLGLPTMIDTDIVGKPQAPVRRLAEQCRTSSIAR